MAHPKSRGERKAHTDHVAKKRHRHYARLGASRPVGHYRKVKTPCGCSRCWHSHPKKKGKSKNINESTKGADG